VQHGFDALGVRADLARHQFGRESSVAHDLQGLGRWYRLESSFEDHLDNGRGAGLSLGEEAMQHVTK